MRKRSLFVAAAAVAVVSSPSTAFSTGGGSGSHRNSAISVPHHPKVTTSSVAGVTTPALTALHATSDEANNQTFDQRAFELKNLSRKKFGLKPMTEQDFADLQIQVRAMEADQALKAENMRQSRAAAAASQQSPPSPVGRRHQQHHDNIFAIMAKSLLGESTCESNYDCARPQVCCDLGFKKMCCSSGKGIFEPQAKMELTPVPAAVRRDD
jgi:hypothetical protein